jgi:dTDP-4-dehydrorhamnose 3,5-epimerase-like enzyme
MYKAAHFLEFPRLGDSCIGYISVAEMRSMPFEVKRSFWTFATPESIVRGRHAHHRTEQVLFSLNGRIIVTTEDATGKVNSFVLDRPEIGLYIPPNIWHTMQYAHDSVQLVFASTEYDESDYIRDINEFQKVWR